MLNKKCLIISSVLVVSISLTGTSLSLLSAKSETKTNEFFPGTLEVQIIENDNHVNGTNIVTPETSDNKTTLKKVQVKNLSNPHEVDAYIRVMLVPTFRNSDGDSLAGNVTLDPEDTNIINVTAADGSGTVTLHLNLNWKNYWNFRNGYFYYIPIVHPGEYTNALLENVTVSDQSLWSTFNLEVLSDSLQAENGAATEAWK
ncbi:MAG: hypothetical protein LIR50_14030 [Bacillota bacterium]|nr:hypothetical protein [Bacillota bacterium]